MSDNGVNPPRGQFNPGWNDPPMLQYNNAVQPARTRLNLNKRIAFPLQGGPTISKPTAIVRPSSHPPHAMPPIAIVPPMSHVNPMPNATDLGDSDRQFCMNTFQNFISKIEEDTNIRQDEVQRRINVINDMWLSPFTSSVKRRLHNVAKALIENNFNEAIENHRALVFDHSNMCTAWGAALRQIILTIQGNGSEVAQDQTAQQQTTAGIVLIPASVAPVESTLQTHDDAIQHI